MRKILLSDDGFFTLEAVLVFPVALAIILLVMQIWFFRYNRVLQETDTMQILVHASQMQDMSPEERTSFLVSELQGRYRDKYMAWNFGDISASFSKGKLSCLIRGSGGFSGGGMIPWNVSGGGEAATDRSKNTVSEVFVIRSFRKLLGVEQKVEELLGE